MIEGEQCAEAQEIADDGAREEIAVADAHLIVPEIAHIHEPLKNCGDCESNAEPRVVAEAALCRRDEKAHHGSDGVAREHGKQNTDDVEAFFSHNYQKYNEFQ